MNKDVVDLNEEERKELTGMVSKGKAGARRVKRANILLMADSGKSDVEIAQMLTTGESTVHRTRQRFVVGNLGNAVNEQPRPGRKRKLSGKQEAILVATACSRPPEGRRRWTMKLLAGRLVEIEEVGKIAAETIRLTLKKTNSSLGLKSNGVSRR